VKRRDKFR